jgi:hypothetical protein
MIQEGKLAYLKDTATVGRVKDFFRGEDVAQTGGAATSQLIRIQVGR